MTNFSADLICCETWLEFILRFREYQIAITADIESLFLPVAVPKEEFKVFVSYGVKVLKKASNSSSTLGTCLGQKVLKLV